jgi:hypothetical protein
MAARILSARTMNFDGLRSSWVRKLTMYTLATGGRKIAEKLGEGKGVGPSAAPALSRFRFGSTSRQFHARFSLQSLRGVIRMSPTVKTPTV